MNSIRSCLVLLVLYSLSNCSQGQVALEGPCPNVPDVPNFNVSAYMGLWYEVAKYPAIFEADGKCITANYEILENGTVSVLNSQFNIKQQSIIEVEGTAQVVENAKLIVQFPGQSTPKESNYWIIGTDYTNYSVVLSCIPTSDSSHTEIVWILTRKRVPSMDTVINALVVITSNKLSLNYLSETNQEGCESQ